MLLQYTQKIEVRKPLVRTTGGVKSVLPPSQQLAGDVACCGKPLKLEGTTPLPKGSGGTRVMTGSNGNNPSGYMGNPQCYDPTCVMVAAGRHSETERPRVLDEGRPTPRGLKIQSKPRTKGGDELDRFGTHDGLSTFIRRTTCAMLYRGKVYGRGAQNERQDMQLCLAL